MMDQSIPLIRQFIALIKMKSFDSSLAFAEELSESIISNLDLRIVKKMSHVFSPMGITLGYILSQSHLLIHTYPEDKIIHIDLAVCSDYSKKEFKESLRHAFSEYKVDFIKIQTINFTAARKLKKIVDFS